MDADERRFRDTLGVVMRYRVASVFLRLVTVFSFGLLAGVLMTKSGYALPGWLIWGPPALLMLDVGLGLKLHAHEKELKAVRQDLNSA